MGQLHTKAPRQSISVESTTPAASIMSGTLDLNRSSRTPVYFLGIGGPNFMEDTSHPAFAKLTAVGREITTKVKPKAVVVFSAHWQGGPDEIKINVAAQTDIIYDFYGFPQHYYEFEYPNKGSSEIAERVIESNGALTTVFGQALWSVGEDFLGLTIIIYIFVTNGTPK